MGVVVGANRLYTDGGSVGPNPSPYGAPFAWCFVSANDEILLSGDGMLVKSDEGFPAYQHRPWYVTYVLPEFDTFSNNLSEAAGLYDAVRFMPDGWSGQIVSDSEVTLGRFFKGWNWRKTKTSAGLPDKWMREWQQHRDRLGTLTPVLVAGHPSDHDLVVGRKRNLPVSRFNRYCDSRCNEVIAGYKTVRGLR